MLLAFADTLYLHAIQKALQQLGDAATGGADVVKHTKKYSEPTACAYSTRDTKSVVDIRQKDSAHRGGFEPCHYT